MKTQKAAVSVAGGESVLDPEAASVAIVELAERIIFVVATEFETAEAIAFAVAFAFQIMSTPQVSPTIGLLQKRRERD